MPTHGQVTAGGDTGRSTSPDEMPSRQFGSRIDVHRLRSVFSIAWLPWLMTRVVTLAALALARYENHHFKITDAKAITTTHGGLLSWDASWYLSIAERGYGGTARSGLRFFPLHPLLGRVLHVITFVPAGGTLVVLANACALAATMLIAHLTWAELGDRDAARRAAWLFSLAPPAFVYVMGYAEALLMLLATASILCLRTRRWTAAALLGLLAGLARPIGFVLVVPAIIEARRDWRHAPARSRAARIGAIAAPIAGLLVYLTWVAVRFDDFFGPVREQREGLPRSISNNPFANVARDVSGFVSGRHLGSGLHIPWIAVAVVLCVIAFRVLPASYGGFAAAVIVVALGATNFESFERYAFTAFPLVITAAAVLLRSRRVETTVLILSALALFGYALLAFQGAYVP